MIEIRNQVPLVYTNASRDFQYLSWLINVVLNSVKHNIDDMYQLPTTKANPMLAALLASTLGFKIKRNYDQKQLTAIVSILPMLLKYKGTEKAITMAGEALISASGSVGSFSCSLKDHLLEVQLPEDLVDITLFMDLLTYILPAGITCRVIRKTQVHNVYATKIGYTDSILSEWREDLEYDLGKQDSIGLATLFDTGNVPAAFSNFYTVDDKNPDTEDIQQLNSGLFTNTVIPAIIQSTDTLFNAESEENSL